MMVNDTDQQSLWFIEWVSSTRQPRQEHNPKTGWSCNPRFLTVLPTLGCVSLTHTAAPAGGPVLMHPRCLLGTRPRGYAGGCTELTAAAESRVPGVWAVVRRARNHGAARETSRQADLEQERDSAGTGTVSLPFQDEATVTDCRVPQSGQEGLVTPTGSVNVSMCAHV